MAMPCRPAQKEAQHAEVATAPRQQAGTSGAASWQRSQPGGINLGRAGLQGWRVQGRVGPSSCTVLRQPVMKQGATDPPRQGRSEREQAASVGRPTFGQVAAQGGTQLGALQPRSHRLTGPHKSAQAQLHGIVWAQAGQGHCAFQNILG